MVFGRQLGALSLLSLLVLVSFSGHLVDGISPEIERDAHQHRCHFRGCLTLMNVGHPQPLKPPKRNLITWKVVFRVEKAVAMASAVTWRGGHFQ